MKKKIYVVAAIIKENNKYLCTQRGRKGILYGKWEFPGGKIENGETHQQALEREIEEELNIKIQANKIIKITEYEYPFAIINLTFIECELISNKDQIKLNVHLDLKWIKKEDFNTIDWAEADIEILNSL